MTLLLSLLLAHLPSLRWMLRWMSLMEHAHPETRILRARSQIAKFKHLRFDADNKPFDSTMVARLHWSTT